MCGYLPLLPSSPHHPFSLVNIHFNVRRVEETQKACCCSSCLHSPGRIVETLAKIFCSAQLRTRSLAYCRKPRLLPGPRGVALRESRLLLLLFISAVFPRTGFTAGSASIFARAYNLLVGDRTRPAPGSAGTPGAEGCPPGVWWRK